MSDHQSALSFDDFATTGDSKSKKQKTSQMDESESVRSNGSGQSIALSDVLPSIAEAYLGRHPDTIEQQNTNCELEDIIPNFEKTPEKVLKAAYRAISKFYNLYGYPRFGTNEATTSRALNALLKPIVWHFRKRGIDLKTLRLESERCLKWTFMGRKMQGKMDYSAEATGLPAQTFIVVECKASKLGISSTLKQCFLYLKRVWEKEGGDVIFFLFSPFQITFVDFEIE